MNESVNQPRCTTSSPFVVPQPKIDDVPVPTIDDGSSKLSRRCSPSFLRCWFPPEAKRKKRISFFWIPSKTSKKKRYYTEQKERTMIDSSKRVIGNTVGIVMVAVVLLGSAASAWTPTTTETMRLRRMLPSYNSYNGNSFPSIQRTIRPIPTNRRSSSSSLSTPSTTTTTLSSTTQSTAAATSSTTTTTVDLSYTEWTARAHDSTTASSSLPPVVFLHGLLGNKKNFASLARSLANQLRTPRRIFGIDLRNHGESTNDTNDDDNDTNLRNDMSYPSMAADVVAFMDTLELSTVVLVGHSMGGKVAQAVALRYPHRVDGLVVLDMAPVRYAEQADSTWQAVCAIVRRLDQVPAGLSKKQVDVALRNDIPDPALRAFCLTNWENGTWKIPMHIITQQLPTLAAFDIETTTTNHDTDQNNNDHDSQNHDNNDNAASSLTSSSSSLTYAGDAFFIHGGQSRFVRHAHLPAIRQYFPNHMLTTIRGSGHWVHAEAPEDTLSLLLQFLDR